MIFFLATSHPLPVTRYGITLRCLAGCGVDYDAGRVPSWSMQKTPQANGAHFRSTLGSGPSTPLPINGSVLGLTKKEPMSCGYLVASCR
jgi:hypothetical protein